MEEIIEPPDTPEGDKMIYTAIIKRAFELKDKPFMDIAINFAAAEQMIWNLINHSESEEENKAFAEEVNGLLKKHVEGASALLAEVHASHSETSDPITPPV